MSKKGLGISVRIARFGGFIVLLAVLGLTAGCSSFNRQWKKAGEQAATADGMIGRWEGVWKSDANGHTGRLRAIVTKEDNNIYEVRFRASYLKILRFGYTVPMHVEKTNDTFKFNGEADLGWMAGGLYTYDGRVEGTNFYSTYKSKKDHGIFQMGRP